MSNKRHEKTCEYCGASFIAKTTLAKYCSERCLREADKANKRGYKEKPLKICEQCGEEFPANRSGQKFCSKKCYRRYRAININKTCFNHGELTKICIICGKEFQTYRSRKTTCSDECSKKHRNGRERKRPYNPEKDRKKYLKKHPNARKREDIIREAQEKRDIKRANYEKWHTEKEKEWAEIRARKEAQKQANIAQWLEYEVEHSCCECGKKFIAHYPTAKYCSNTCRQKKYRKRKRYEGITIDKNITLGQLAERDHNQCQICGLFVNWNDYTKTDKAVVCGDMYPSIDHIKPISLGGVHSWDNIQLAHRRCNTVKGNRL